MTDSEKERLNFTTQAIVVVIVLLLAMAFALGYAMVTQSKGVIKGLINERMLDVANTAAAMLDGDEFDALEAEDEQTPEYQEIYRILATFRDSIDLEYIYGIRQVGERDFIFTIDPSYGTPGEFGQAIVYTDALYEASKGTPAVDEVPYVDDWGSHYSAYSPIYNSAGKMVGLVGVDFNAGWYDEEIAAYTRTAFLIGGVSLVAGALIVFIVMGRFRKRFQLLSYELSALAADVESLNREVVAGAQGVAEDPNADSAPAAQVRSEDDIDALGGRIRAMQNELRASIEHVRSQAYTDSLTGAGNARSYAEAVDMLIDRQENEDAAPGYSVVVFDINGLKQANDNFGHAQGDKLIVDAANALMAEFGKEHVFRIGGDEFVAVLEGVALSAAQEACKRYGARVAAINQREDRVALPLAVSCGAAAHEPGDANFRAVFKRADELMYADKAAYYATHADRRRA